ncbi:MAG: inositol monophosphatase family protein, partial [Alphaproteobacteria bacterium]
LAEGDVSEKGPGNLVTVADLAAEARLSRGLVDIVPGSVVVGEEAVESQPERMAHLEGAPPVWIVDPVDGTGNFVDGSPEFAVMVAYLVGGACVAGWIHDPLRDVTAVAMRDDGAWMDDRRLEVAAPAPLDDMRGALYYRSREPAFRDHLRAASARLGDIRNHRCAGQEYLRLVDGRIHFAVFSRLNPWDHVAGALIHGEAGGSNARLDGTPYRPDWARDATWTPQRGLMMAPDRETWQRLHRLFFATAPGWDGADFGAANEDG